ncbi:MAG: GNAT family N-acetyltransferase [Chthoniobacterales bacterium]|nr:GNAT family N-acetyltransferase [Chthoniobacterales bacterium]
MNFNVRAAQLTDAKDLGSVHVRSWQKAYSGLMPQAYLDKLTISERQAMWAKKLAKFQENKNIFVIELDSKVRGFIVFGSSNTENSSKVGEIIALNIDPISWNQGFGSVILDRALNQLQKDGFEEAILWTLPTNIRAIRFYESRHWKSNGNKRVRELLGITIDEICYHRYL